MALADKPAFPQQREVPLKVDAHTTYFKTEVTGGMTLLEHYAGLAMQGLCAASGSAFREEAHLNACVGLSAQLARRLITELEKVNP